MRLLSSEDGEASIYLYTPHTKKTSCRWFEIIVRSISATARYTNPIELSAVFYTGVDPDVHGPKAPLAIDGKERLNQDT